MSRRSKKIQKLKNDSEQLANLRKQHENLAGKLWEYVRERDRLSGKLEIKNNDYLTEVVKNELLKKKNELLGEANEFLAAQLEDLESKWYVRLARKVVIRKRL